MRWIGVVVATVLVLGGCGGEEQSPPRVSSSATSVNPSATLPTLPADAEEFSARGAATFTAHFVQSFNHAYRTGDTSGMHQRSARGCEGCQRYIELIDSIFDNGGWTQGRSWTQSGATIEFRSDQSRETYVSTELTLSAGKLKVDAATPVKHYSASSTQVTFGLRFDAGWRITQFGLEEPK